MDKSSSSLVIAIVLLLVVGVIVAGICFAISRNYSVSGNVNATLPGNTKINAQMNAVPNQSQ